MKKSMKHLTVILLMFVLLIVACSKVKDEGTPPGSGTGGTTSLAGSILLASNPTTVSSIGQATITARVTDSNGNPVTNGTVVTFTLSDSSMGTLSGGGSASTSNGTAVITFTPAAGKTGSVTINATSGSVKNSITISITTASTMVLSVSASPASVTTGGTTQVTARVVDSSGNAAPDGTVVTFSLDNGLKGSIINTQTTTNGDATVTFTAGSMSTVAVVTATVGTATATAPITITGGTGATVLVTASTTSISAGSTSVITATVRDSLNNAVVGATVTFSLNDATKAALSSTTGVTDASGVATVTLTGTAAPFVTVSATALGAINSVSINIMGSASVGTIAISAAPTTVNVGGSVAITALVRDSSNQPIPAGQIVNFSLSSATAGVLSSATGTTSASGVASVTFTAALVPTSVTVTASYPTYGLNASVNITITAPPPANIVSTATPTAITVMGTSSITAVVTDANGTAVLDGTQVTFTLSDSSYGSLSNSTSSTSGGTGTATITFTAGNKTGAVTISIVAGTVTKTITVTINPAATGNIQFVSAVPQVIGIKGSGQIESSAVSFMVNDINGNPVSDGIAVTFQLQGPGGSEYIGTTPGSKTAAGSTVNGLATVILNSGNVAGPVTIIASTLVGGVTISSSATQISIGGGAPSAGHWNLATSQISMMGLSVSDLQADISAYISDRFGNYNILTGTVINFYTEAGAINTQGTTDATGKTSVKIRTQTPMPSDVSNAVIADANPYFSTEPWYPGSTYNYNPRDGWVTVLATTMGEEAFMDENGDGLLTRSYSASACPPGYTCECDNGTAGTYAGCVTSQTNGPASCNNLAPYTCAAAGFGNRSEGFIDLGEPFYDRNDNGVRDDGSIAGSPFEQFIDANNNAAYNGPNGVWDGPGCQSTGCLSSKMIWEDIKLVFTYNTFMAWPNPDGTNCYATGGGCSASYANAGASAPFASAPTSMTQKGGSGNFCVRVADWNLNSPPGGTVINATATPAQTVTPSSLTLVDGLSYGPATYCFTVKLSSTETAVSTLVSVGVSGSAAFATLTVPLDLPLPPAAPTGVTATPTATAGSIRVSWNGVSGADSYNVYLRTSPGGANIFGVNSTTLNGTVSALTSGTTYYFVVTAVGPGGESVVSTETAGVKPL